MVDSDADSVAWACAGCPRRRTFMITCLRHSDVLACQAERHSVTKAVGQQVPPPRRPFLIDCGCNALCQLRYDKAMDKGIDDRKKWADSFVGPAPILDQTPQIAT